MPFADAIIQKQAGCLFCDDFPRVRLELQKWAEESDETRLVSVELAKIPEIASLNDDLIDHLAHAALLLWPDWYHGRYHLDHTAEFGIYADQVRRNQPRVKRKWLTAAASRCHQGRVPALKQFSATLQARQLRLALSDQQLVIAVFVADPDPPGERLLGLSRALEWLAREAEASVPAVLPTSLSKRPELDAINSAANIWPMEPPETEPVISVTRESVDAPQSLGEERKHLVCPIVGRPHPGSPGEQRLAKQLATDDELRDLFQFNQRVTSVLDNRFIVDLLWRGGRIVVEIDGYGWHSSRSMFNSDRQRDYELTISNYLVLRLPHDFVVQDPALACERIREFVQFRRQHPVPQEITA